jgi:hypothetical protein
LAVLEFDFVSSLSANHIRLVFTFGLEMRPSLAGNRIISPPRSVDSGQEDSNETVVPFINDDCINKLHAFPG